MHVSPFALVGQVLSRVGGQVVPGTGLPAATANPQTKRPRLRAHFVRPTLASGLDTAETPAARLSLQGGNTRLLHHSISSWELHDPPPGWEPGRVYLDQADQILGGAPHVQEDETQLGIGASQGGEHSLFADGHQDDVPAIPPDIHLIERAAT